MKQLSNQVQDGTLPFSDYNQHAEEVEQIIQQFGRTLSGSDLLQALKSIVLLASASDYYTPGGTVNAITLTPLSGVQGADQLADGYSARFRPTGANTGAVTINLNSLGAKALVLEDGTALASDELQSDVDAWIRYDAGGDRFYLLNPISAGTEELISTTAISAQTSVDIALPSAGGFDEYRVEFRDFTTTVNNTDVDLRFSQDGGSTFFAGSSDYENVWQQQSQGGQQNDTGDANSTYVVRQMQNAAADYYSGDMKIHQPGNGTIPCSWVTDGSGTRGSGFRVWAGGNLNPATTNALNRVDFMRLLVASGTFDGTVRVFGIRR